jgi:hypothetical protein
MGIHWPDINFSLKWRCVVFAVILSAESNTLLKLLDTAENKMDKKGEKEERRKEKKEEKEPLHVCWGSYSRYAAHTTIFF